jgi:hypothetical protein
LDEVDLVGRDEEVDELHRVDERERYAKSSAESEYLSSSFLHLGA